MEYREHAVSPTPELEYFPLNLGLPGDKKTMQKTLIVKGSQQNGNNANKKMRINEGSLGKRI